MKWSFPHNNDGDINGINNSGVETFLGTPLKSLAREICQNSIDAALNSKPVRVEFMPFVLEPEELPDSDALEKAFVASLSFWAPQSSKKAKDFFKKAIDIMHSGSIPCLRISDFNTTGLSGSDKEYNTPWCNLTKSSGTSDKAGTAGGSFGIGKFAPYACSDFRTVFYNTLDINNVSAHQGISRITSFRREDGKIAVGVGYCGDEGNKPVYKQVSLDPNFKRSQGMTGTDIYIAAFNRHSSDWQNDVIASVLDGFLVAIFRGKLIVKVDDVKICAETLPELLQEYKGNISENAEKYYLVLTSPDTKWYRQNYRNYGDISLGLIINPDMHRRVAMVRKTGMKIMDKGGISNIIPFAGVMLIDGEKINDFLRNIENPQHTKWEPDRAERRSYAADFIRGLSKFINESLNELKNEDTDEEIDPSVGEYLPDEMEYPEEPLNTTAEAITNAIKTVEKTVLKRKPSPSDMSRKGTSTEKVDESGDTEDENISGAGHTQGHSSSGNDGIGENDGSGRGENPKPVRKILTEIAPAKVRTVCLDKDSGEYSVNFVPSIDAENGCIELYMSAETGSYEAAIVSVIGFVKSEVIFKGNRISNLNFKADESVRLRVKIDYSDFCSMEVKAYGNKI
ncbi:MAG: hypothetical protein ACRC3H_19825 [Lachnospiraceae bacterium]